jgi:hypothetical protein
LLRTLELFKSSGCATARSLRVRGDSIFVERRIGGILVLRFLGIRVPWLSGRFNARHGVVRLLRRCVRGRLIIGLLPVGERRVGADEGEASARRHGR